MKAIKFTRNCHVYNAGEIAGFEDSAAEAYIAAGAAVPYEAPVVPDTPAEQPAEQPKKGRRG
jgi:hypothetical protein